MGCDGGTIPKRDELVRVKKKPEQKDKTAEQSFKWRHCALSQQKLQEPIVACGLGRLYSKSTVIESLLDKANKPESISHIKSLKDVKDLNVKKNPAHTEAETSSGVITSSPYICPIIGLEMTGNFRFLFLWSCGCVISERAFKEIKQKNCTLCQQPFTSEDIVIINGNEEDVFEMREKMEIRISKRKTGKKDKKNGCVPISNGQASISETSCTQNGQGASASSSTSTQSELPSSSKVLSNGHSETKLLKCDKEPSASNKNNVALKRNAVKSLEDPLFKKTKEDYCVAKDPKATEVYKSLFTSHKSDKEQNRAHWVTYNPFYN